MPANGRRPWKLASDPHARTFLESPGTYRATAKGPNEHGSVAFWAEWEGAVKLVRELDPEPRGPRWLCRPDPTGPPPAAADGTPPQNTDPLCGETRSASHSVARLKTRRLRRLGRGSLILFGSTPAAGFVLDTVFVVDSWIEHRRQGRHRWAHRRRASPMDDRTNVRLGRGLYTSALLWRHAGQARERNVLVRSLPARRPQPRLPPTGHRAW